MKICPQCAFANEERFPACLWCNALLVDVRSTWSTDPTHPEHAARRLHHARLHRQRRQSWFILFTYVGAITFLAAVPGLCLVPAQLACFAATAFLVGLGLTTSRLGSLSSMFVQGVLSTALVLHFGLLNFLTAFMLLGHIVASAVCAHWVDLLDSTHR